MTLEEIDLIIEGKINIIDKYRLELNNLKQKRKEIIALMNTEIKPSRLNLTDLKNFINEFVGFDIGDKKKTMYYTWSRMVYCKIAKDNSHYSLREIGEALGGRNHATVIHNISQFNDNYKFDPEFKREANKIIVHFNKYFHDK
jgi:chromosomal replication initiation ATPase DnaA